jgi:hypothetical protein
LNITAEEKPYSEKKAHAYEPSAKYANIYPKSESHSKRTDGFIIPGTQYNGKGQTA